MYVLCMQIASYIFKDCVSLGNNVTPPGKPLIIASIMQIISICEFFFALLSLSCNNLRSSLFLFFYIFLFLKFWTLLDFGRFVGILQGGSGVFRNLLTDVDISNIIAG